MDRAVLALVDEAAAEADGDRMGPRAGLQLGEQMADMAFDRLLAQKEPEADLAVHEAVGNQLQNLDLAGRGILAAALVDGAAGTGSPRPPKHRGAQPPTRTERYVRDTGSGSRCAVQRPRCTYRHQATRL